jgi:hypothetical protein
MSSKKIFATLRENNEKNQNSQGKFFLNYLDKNYLLIM